MPVFLTPTQHEAAKQRIDKELTARAKRRLYLHDTGQDVIGVGQEEFLAALRAQASK